jgi:CubicO group peptidase (beta-lactamase class C family)
VDKQNLTLRQLGGHLTGIRHYKGFEFLSNIHYTNITDPLEVFIHDTLLCEPGTAFNYTTYGWTLISAVMEKAAKKPFLDIVKDEIQDPLQLNDLKADQKDSTGFQRVSFYEYQDSLLIASPVVDISNKWAGGGFLCSAEDLAKFGYAVAKPGLLKEKTLDMFTQSQTTSDGEQTNYGIGFRIGQDDDGRRWYGHSGGSVGGSSMLLIYPEQDLAIVTLVNLSSAEMDDLAWKIGKLIMKSEK